MEARIHEPPGGARRGARIPSGGAMRPTHHWLLVEDDPVDAKGVVRALERLSASVELTVATEGTSAWERLEGWDELPGAGPDLILLDLNLPHRSGHELLAELKRDPGWRHVPVVVLTTSDHERDVGSAYGRGAAGYFVKPYRFPEFVEMIAEVLAYWRRAERPLPPETSAP